MDWARRITGTVALVTYLVIGAMLYLTVLPGVDGRWPPDFHLTGYDLQSVGPFVRLMTDEARETYVIILTKWDRLFIAAFAIWLALVGWRGGALRYWVAGLAALYAGIDLAENAAIHRFVSGPDIDAAMVSVAHNLTMAKFASFYLCVLVLIWHLRRER